jgi:hypothetical protein
VIRFKKKIEIYQHKAPKRFKTGMIPSSALSLSWLFLPLVRLSPSSGPGFQEPVPELNVRGNLRIKSLLVNLWA